MTIAQVFLLVVGVVVLWLLFLRPDNPLFEFICYITRSMFFPPAALLLWLLRALLLGYCAYALTTTLWSFDRIQSFGDIWLLLHTRPSRLGAPGLLGVLAGVLFAGWAYSGGGRPSPSVRFIRGRYLSEGPSPLESSALALAKQQRDRNKSRRRT